MCSREVDDRQAATARSLVFFAQDELLAKKDVKCSIYCRSF
jgi:hypothetical protein